MLQTRKYLKQATYIMRERESDIFHDTIIEALKLLLRCPEFMEALSYICQVFVHPH